MAIRRIYTLDQRIKCLSIGISIMLRYWGGKTPHSIRLYKAIKEKNIMIGIKRDLGLL